MISIIIIVKNDRRIENLFKSLEKINNPLKNEIIVIDASAGFLNDIKNKYKNVTWLYFNQKNKTRTYAEQRNIGIKRAKGDIIVFIDADCIPDTKWLSELIKPINEKNENIVSGSIRPINNKSIHKEEHYEKYRDECETMNMALTKEVIAKVGFFDENMEGCEDSDYCIRARDKGFKIYYQKSAIVYHDWGGFLSNVKRSFNGGQDRASLYKKYPKLLFTFSINNIYTLFYLLYILFLPLVFLNLLYIFIILLPSLIKRRNPIKEIYNLFFSIGLIFKLIKYLIQ